MNILSVWGLDFVNILSLTKLQNRYKVDFPLVNMQRPVGIPFDTSLVKFNRGGHPYKPGVVLEVSLPSHNFYCFISI